MACRFHALGTRWDALLWLAALLAISGGSSPGATLEVGPGKAFSRIEYANAKAQPGDLILVYPRENGLPYEKAAVQVRQKQVTFRGVPGQGQRGVKISGKGFRYTGAGSTPRAIFQFNRGADDCVLVGFELTDAHNDSNNGAGLRINQANRVTVRHCSIHDNDMGIMSNGDGSLDSAADQRIEHCEIHHNGDFRNPGYNHNLYLGGASVTLRFCEVHSSLTGHNVKSRAHFTRVEWCYVRHSSNREFDLVDAAETTQPESHAVLVGNVIVKDPKCSGNRGVIHFGQDGGREHDGALYLTMNTIVTPFISPVVDLSAAKARARLVGNLVSDGGVRQARQTIAAARNGARLAGVTGKANWFSGDFVRSVAETGLIRDANLFDRPDFALFVNPKEHNYRLRPEAAKRAAVELSPEDLAAPQVPGMPERDTLATLGWQYHHPAGKEPRPAEDRPTLGAYAGRPR